VQASNKPGRRTAAAERPGSLYLPIAIGAENAQEPENRRLLFLCRIRAEDEQAAAELLL
jgi:hypothetical protein